MARVRPSDRISNLVSAGLHVFSTKGFRRAQMADIAHEMGVSPGLLYSYVESKEALLFLVFDRGFGSSCSPEPALPVRTPPPGAIAKRIADVFRTHIPIPTLSAALARPRADDAAGELASIVRELYAGICRLEPAIAILDRSAPDVPELRNVFYIELRGGFVSALARFIAMRTKAGQFRRVPHPDITARLVIEAVSWFARNRRGDPTQKISDESAEETVVDFVVNALVRVQAAHANENHKGR